MPEGEAQGGQGAKEGQEMSHAERCPVCFGSGKVRPVADCTGRTEVSCYGCDGKGWVTVQDSDTFWWRPLWWDERPYFPQPDWGNTWASDNTGATTERSPGPYGPGDNFVPQAK